jgi:citronellol/citronellal dehydrogenase
MAQRLSHVNPGAKRRPSDAPPATGAVWNDSACTLGGGGSLKGKTVFIAGGSRGIGFCIAKKCAADGANVVISGKTAEPHPTLPGTIHTSAAACEALGGKALACIVDVRDESTIEKAVAAAVAKFGGIDVLINCASAIFPQPTHEFNTSRFNLMFEVGPRGSMLTAKHCLPYLMASAKNGKNPHVLNLSPPIVLSGHPDYKGIGQANYMINKLGMTISAISISEEYKKAGVAGNTMWPVGLVTTSALNHMMANDKEKIDNMMQNGRTPQIQADAAYAIITSSSSGFTGNMCIDEQVLRKAGETDFKKYDYITLGDTVDARLANILAN